MIELTPELVEAIGKATVSVVAGIGAIVATVTSAVAAFYTWKNRYEIDKLYAATYRPNADGTPGPMRQHPPGLVKFFGCRTPNVQDPPAADPPAPGASPP